MGNVIDAELFYLSALAALECSAKDFLRGRRGAPKETWSQSLVILNWFRELLDEATPPRFANPVPP